MTRKLVKRDLEAMRLKQQALQREQIERMKRLTYRGIRAELYKLNIYSESWGLFRSQVETPRRDFQLGSLVVCLPVHFEGGALEVRHCGIETKND